MRLPMSRAHANERLEAMSESMRDDARSGGEAGFALILAILALLLLTFLGLTLATTTSTELQVATNYRWGQQAYYVAQAALDIARRQLREQTTWQIFLPVARTTQAEMGARPMWAPPVPPARDFENSTCDTGPMGGNEGYGVVLWPAGFIAPYQDVSAVPGTGQSLGGAFTIWIRRPLKIDPTTGIATDDTRDDTAIVTAEGTAPFVETGNPVGAYQYRRRAVRVLEIEITKVDQNDCENRGGQTGNSPTGSGYDPCYGVTGAGLPGAPKEINPGQN